jgi:hypothetical protein
MFRLYGANLVVERAGIDRPAQSEQDFVDAFQSHPKFSDSSIFPPPLTSAAVPSR